MKQSHFCNSDCQLPIPVLIRQRIVSQLWTTPRTVHPLRVHTSNRIPYTSVTSDNQLLSCYVINVCSFNKPNALQLLITELCNFAVDAAVTETWLNSNVGLSSCELTISGYKLFRCDREGRKDGGLCIFVKDSITADSIIILTANSESKSDHIMHEILYLNLVKNNQVFLFLLVYHSPRAKYNPSTLLDRLTNDVEHLTDLYPNAVVYLTGDFSQLNTSVFLSDTGMHQTVTVPTRGKNTLDMFITNRPDEVNVSTFQTCMRTDHCALLVNCAQAKTATVGPNSRRKVKFYDLRRPDMFALAQTLNGYDWSCITMMMMMMITLSDDIDFAYKNFLSITTTVIKNNIPQSYLTIITDNNLTDNNPTYITHSGPAGQQGRT